jgi:hypothetical protein
MNSMDLLFSWPTWVMQSLTRPLADLRNLVDVDLSDLVDVNIQSGPLGATGDPGIERNVYTGVARVGKQLGCIADAVLEVAMKTGHADGKDVGKLIELVEEIEKVKRKTAESRARESLDYLRKTDPEGYRTLIRGELGNLEGPRRKSSRSSRSEPRD